ncbi:hypothetical protein JOB18_009502 [Solea senegalensis]|uniref:Uncharacterized protein n=1 Tax=Solea senegalensis TaxID=28829 RepID=A0AAV6RMG7_SOLSE|nr:hypothetical protein JOB18_009502 [Solea senegalensis]
MLENTQPTAAVRYRDTENDTAACSVRLRETSVECMRLEEEEEADDVEEEDGEGEEEEDGSLLMLMRELFLTVINSGGLTATRWSLPIESNTTYAT